MTATFPLNAWYAAAWDHEVRRSLLARTICGRRVVLYRTLAGAPVALANSCWHRLLPLSKGRLTNDDVVCGYHGLAFGPTGRCTHAPAQDSPPPNAAVTAYPVVERHRFVWLWPGDPSLADEALIPELPWMTDGRWAADGGMLHVKADFRLLLDNLMDLTHEQFVHGDTIGQEHLSEAPFDVAHDQASVTLQRRMAGVEPPAFFRAMLARTYGPNAPGPVDRWQVIRFRPPHAIVIDAGVHLSDDHDRRTDGRVINMLTPETATSTHYFWAYARDFLVDDPRLTRELVDTITRVFGQDVDVVEAQQAELSASTEPLRTLAIDAGGRRVRGLIDRMVRTEAQPAAQAAE